MKYLFLILIAMTSFSAFPQKKYESDWKKVDSLNNLGQSRSALDLVNKIYEETKGENNAPQFVKSSIYRMALQSGFEEDFMVKNIAQTEADILTASHPVKNILHSVLAELYWRYYENNRYKFINRTETQGFSTDDISTWDLKKIVQKCIENYSLSLENPEMLKKAEISQYNVVLLQHKETRKFRSTLFDFLSHRAIDFYLNSEAGLTQPAARFLVDEAAYFQPSEAFSSIQITTNDTLSFEFQAIRLLQQVIAFHAMDKDPSALVDAEIERLNFVHEHCILPEKDSLYLEALHKLESRFLNHPSSTDISYEIARQLINTAAQYQPLNSDAHKWEMKEAFTIADAAIHRFPGTDGSNNCRFLLEQIGQRTLDVTSDYANVPGKASLALVSYKNIPELFFRLLRIDPNEDRNLSQSGQKNVIKEYIGRDPEKKWSQSLPDDGDYQNHKAEIRLPALSPGFYALLASPDKNFNPDTLISLSRFWSTSISYISRRQDDGSYELYVLDRQEGQPLDKIKVQSFFREYEYSTRKYRDLPGQISFTDKNGFVSIPAGKKERNNQYYLVFSSAKDQFITESYFSGYNYRTEEPRAVISTHFFTDRAIYRPGQTIYFKGIVVESKGNDVKIKSSYRTAVMFYDVNGQKVSSLDLVTNDFGSFTGTFTAPQGALTGQMNIQCETGSVSVQVEEYKRPKFEVTFKPVEGSYKLGETVTITGKAMAFAGNSLGDAQVTFRVVRTARFPYMWWGWTNWMPQSPEMEITNGLATTNAQGEFTIKFTAIADPTVERKFDPVFNFKVSATVADLNGETHDGETSVSVGYKALLISTNLPKEVNLDSAFQFTLTAANLNGQKENAWGKIIIWQLTESKRLLRNRNWNRPDRFTMTRPEFEKEFPVDIYDNEGDISTWEKEKQVFSLDFNTKIDSIIKPGIRIPVGSYLLEIQSSDTFGEKIETKSYFSAWSPSAREIPGNSLSWFTLPVNKAEPGDKVSLLFGSSAKKVHAIYEVSCKSKEVTREIIELDGQKRLDIPVTEDFRGNFALNVAFVKYNRSFQFSSIINVPYTNKKLDISFASFRSKLEPGQKEEWHLTIKDSKGEKAIAEMLAGMYDASLDVFVPHTWSFDLYSYFGQGRQWDGNSAFATRGSISDWNPRFLATIRTREYDLLNWFGYESGYNRPMFKLGGAVRGVAMDMNAESSLKKEEALNPSVKFVEGVVVTENKTGQKGIPPPEPPSESKPDVSQSLKIRSDFNETAFFYPQLNTNENGDLVIKFTLPESLTRWKMMGLAYTKDLKIGQVEKTLIAQKDLMVFPNAPRFFREGDRMQFSTKISNISDHALNGTADLHFFDALTMKPIDDLMKLTPASQNFTAGAGLSTAVTWNITIPEGLQAVVYRVRASAGTFSDGEEAPVPVLTNRMLVTESMPLPINGNQTRNFTLDKLANSGKTNSTLRNYRLSLEFSSNPAWYAVQALPYLMEYPYECAEQLFSRFYANSIATHIANSDPKIKRVFESWKNISPDALRSNLEKNQELKSVLLEESPWVREATNENERKHRIAILFDLNRMSNEQNSALKKLVDMQASNGGWPWFPGMPDSRYITQHIVTGLGHLDHLGVIELRQNPQTWQMLQKAVQYLDERVSEDFDKLKKQDKEYLKNDHLGSDIVQYLYARSYFMEDFPLDKKYSEAFGYYQQQASAYWQKQNNYLKGMLALSLNRFKDTRTPKLIMRSLSETALHNEEMGMYWRNEQHGWFWYQAPIETQSLLIEAYDEVMNDTKAVDELKIWLLKQKQTQDWKTTKATTEAVYALLLRGTSLLASDQLVTVKVGKQLIDPNKLEGSNKPEAGTGYFKTSWDAAQISPEMGKVTVINPNPTVAWGAMYWQYFDQLDKITMAETPLKVSKKLFREVNTPTGPVIEPVTESTPLHVGDKVVVRVELRTDRDMEYIHLKDMRAAAFEPVNVLSGYRYQDGLGYYEATRDASSNFFISYLPKGTYVFEYRLNATQKGDFSNGITSVQCMYAPEFAAHSEGIRVRVE